MSKVLGSFYADEAVWMLHSIYESSNMSVSGYLLVMCHGMEESKGLERLLDYDGKETTSFLTSTIKYFRGSEGSQANNNCSCSRNTHKLQPHVSTCGHCGNLRGETCLARHKASVIQWYIDTPTWTNAVSNGSHTREQKNSLLRFLWSNFAKK